MFYWIIQKLLCGIVSCFLRSVSLSVLERRLKCNWSHFITVGEINTDHMHRPSPPHAIVPLYLMAWRGGSNGIYTEWDNMVQPLATFTPVNTGS